MKSVLDRMSPKLEAFNNLRKQHHRSGSFLDDNHEAAQRSAAQRSGSFLDDNHEAAQRSAAHRSGEKPRVLSKTAPKIQGNKSVQKGGAPQLKKTLMPPRFGPCNKSLPSHFILNVFDSMPLLLFVTYSN